MYKKNLNKGFSNISRTAVSSWAILLLALFSFTAKAELILNGSTIYSDLGKDQFVAALYTETAQNSPQIIHSMESEKRMEVRILNNYSKRRWVNLWMQSISINNGRETFSEAAEDLIALMQAPRSAPKKGDILEYLFSPDRGTSMTFNGTVLITDLSGDVFDLLLRTWIGAIPPSTAFKEELLGNQRNTYAQELLETLAPESERVSLAASWILPPPVVEKPKKTAIPDPISEAVPETIIASVEKIPENDRVPEDNLLEEHPTPETAIALISEDGINQRSETEVTNESETETEDVIDFNIIEALAQRDYTPLVVQKIYQHISYPSRAASRNQEGTVRIAVKIGRSGELESVLATQESKHSSLNKAALKAVEKSAPFPVLPEQISSDSFELSIPITFRLQ